MLQHEIASIIEETNMFDIAYKTGHDMELSSTEKEAAEQLDAWARNIGKTGCDSNKEIAAFVNQVVNEEIYEADDELLSSMFDRATIGEFDDFEYVTDPENTLVAYEAAKGGNVPRSFLDLEVMKPTWRNRQIETDISYADLRRNGWKSVANITEYATVALKNAMFFDIFNSIDTLITTGAANCISESGSNPSQATMDALALYLAEHADPAECNIVALYKYIQAASKLNGFASDNMKDEVHRTGRLGVYDGISMIPVSSAKKVNKGLLLPDKRIFGVAGKVGSLNMKGEINVYEDMDNNNERVHLLFKDFTYGYAFKGEALDRVCKVTLV